MKKFTLSFIMAVGLAAGYSTLVGGQGIVRNPGTVNLSATNPAASATGATVPASASYDGINVGGNLVGATGFSVGSHAAQAIALVDGSGNQITSFGGGTQYATGTAQATPTGTLALGYDGANLRHLLTDASGNLQVEFASAQAVTQSGTWNVTNISGTVSLPTGAATSAAQSTQTTALQLIDNLPNTIGSTTSGQSGALVFGAVTTSAPTYTTAQSHPLSLDTSGNLRITGSISCSNCSGSGASDVEGSTYTLGTDSVAPLGGYADETTPTAVTEDRIGLARITLQRALHVNPRDAAGTQLFGTAAALADNTSNPTVGALATYNMCFDGSAWDRCLTSLLTEATHDTALGTITNVVGGLGLMRASAAAPSDVSADGDAVAPWSLRSGAQVIQSSFAGVLATTGAGATGTGVQRVIEANDSALTVNTAALTTGSSGLKYTTAGATEDEHAVKASAGILYSITATNTNAAARYLRCANAVAGSTTPGTTTPIIDLAIPGQAAGAGFTTSFPQGFAFSTALTCWSVTGAADTDVAEVAANEIKLFYTYK